MSPTTMTTAHQAPKVLARRHAAAAGSATKSGAGAAGAGGGGAATSTTTTTLEKPKPKSGQAGMKVVVRRLPPSLTEQEFVAILGPEWELAKGKVDYFEYCGGKITTNASKISKPSRAYLHLAAIEDGQVLSTAVSQRTWHDAKGSYTDPCLVAPPTAELSLYQRIPTQKRRVDSKQGTIDSDPEFRAFLESLANPASPKDPIEPGAADEAAAADAASFEVTTTPLIEFLKEKRAKEAEKAKAARISRLEAQAASRAKAVAAAATAIAAATEESSRKKKREKGQDKVRDRDRDREREPFKILAKKPAEAEAGNTAKAAIIPGKAPATAAAAENKIVEPPPPVEAATGGTAAAAAAAKANRRAGIAHAARILQKDLGIAPASAHRRARHEAARTDSAAKAPVPPGGDPDKDKADTASPSLLPPGSETSGPSRPPSVSSRASDKPASRPRPRGSRGGKYSEKNGGSNGVEAAPPAGPSQPQPAPAKTPTILTKKKPHPDAGESSSSGAGAGAGTGAGAGPTTETPTAPSANAPVREAGPATTNGNKNTASSGAINTRKKFSAAPAAVTAGATRAFVKNVNRAQGITVEALTQKMTEFGPVRNVEVERRKNYAYVDFDEHSALVRAVEAGPIVIAEGRVQVVERRDREAQGAATAASAESTAAEDKKSRGRRGGAGRGGGGGPKAATHHADSNSEPHPVSR